MPIGSQFWRNHFFQAFFSLSVSPLHILASFFRQLLLPSLAEYAAPLHFNFETCQYQLSGVCSFPTAVVDFSADDVELSPGIDYEVSAEIVLSESTVISNVGIFQVVFEAIDSLNNKKTFRRSCFARMHRGLLRRIYEVFWKLLCRTIFFPIYFVGLLSVPDDRVIEVSFTDRLADHDIAKTVLFYVQLQNRFIEVESAKLLLRARFGLLRMFLYDYPIFSSLVLAIFTYFTFLVGISFYWIMRILLVNTQFPVRLDSAAVDNKSKLSNILQQEVRFYVFITFLRGL
ncbi:unnamed protein product [Gongylonema pulchrum]|uniref:Seipin n=1 Tax=Gongylonema pulchrum TaxID=637853 RepID=A0A183DYT7_9BILA|nr:unnamed protein product [Gongylonema pulchrum]